MSEHDYDLFVIGAGSGGVRAARVSASYGAKVAIAEEYRVGGTCVIRGCIPKKLFVYAGRFAGAFEDAAGFGWNVGKARFDWPVLVTNKNREIDRLEGLYMRTLDNNRVETFCERVVLEDANTVRLTKSKRTVSAKTVLVATGARPYMPDVPGIEHAISSNEAFNLERLPKSIAIVGAGYIALEFATIFNGLGVDVTVLYRGTQVLRGFDDDMRDGLAQEMRGRGVDIRVNTDVASIEKAGKGVRLNLSAGDPLETGLVMYATGRDPNTRDLGLDKAGVVLGERGKILVDEFSRTNVENIYAVGDVTDRAALTPVAIREGAAFAETVFNDNPTKVDYACIPTAVFSEPEVGAVGLTEAQAREQLGDVDIYKSSFRPLLHTLSGREERMIMKLVVDAKSGRVSGCHILGSDAGEIAQTAAIAMQLGATKADFDSTMALHPSAAEELVTMREKWQPEAAE